MNEMILAKMREGDWGAVIRLMREEREGASGAPEPHGRRRFRARA